MAAIAAVSFLGLILAAKDIVKSGDPSFKEANWRRKQLQKILKLKMLRTFRQLIIRKNIL